MSTFRKKNILLPQEKTYLVWIFLGLFSIFLGQFFLYPKLLRIHFNSNLIKSYQKQIKGYEKNIANQLLQKSQFKGIEFRLNHLLNQSSDPLTEFHRQIIQPIRSHANIVQFKVGESLVDRQLEEIPIYLEIKISPQYLGPLLNSLSEFSGLIDLMSLQIRGLSASSIFVKIQLTLLKRRS